MLKIIKNKIKNFRQLKYQNIIFTKNDLKLRNQAIKNILTSNQNFLAHRKNKCASCNFYLKFLNKFNFIVFYKKFNAKLKLKEKYHLSSFKKLSNKDACFNSYLLFGKFLIKNNKINNIQKLNTILKLNDLLILKYSTKKHKKFSKYFCENLLYEKKLLEKFI